MTNSSLEARIKNLEEIEAIKQLKYTYCYNLDTKDFRAVCKLFTDDAIWDGQPFGTCKGKKQITKYFCETVPKKLPFFVHIVHNPIIKAKGDKATGTWYLTEPATLEDNRAIHICGRYDEKYVKVNGSWKFKEMRLKFFYVTPYEKGWVKQKMI